MTTTQVTITQQNDLFRRTLGMGPIPGSVTMTAGVANLEPAQLMTAIQSVMAFDTFTPDNDPHQEHDFGKIIIPNVDTIFWKIDYYDPQQKFGSEDPADLTQTHRVMTIMLAREY